MAFKLSTTGIGVNVGVSVGEGVNVNVNVGIRVKVSAAGRAVKVSVKGMPVDVEATSREGEAGFCPVLFNPQAAVIGYSLPQIFLRIQLLYRLRERRWIITNHHVKAVR